MRSAPLGTPRSAVLGRRVGRHARLSPVLVTGVAVEQGRWQGQTDGTGSGTFSGAFTLVGRAVANVLRTSPSYPRS